ncbi:PaaI family thioesterase [uncultured Tateyamaria sp.]|uniref:PaaI family thioesterase n=1 Tax=Tateyamaria sp. 1078 TaxID=3417464 RepID=UPI002616E286|nr:PaaI family thioesterase [uncultured Tateyamaria sp.]
MDLRPRIQTSFDRQSMMQTFGAQLDAVAPGQVTLSAPILPGSLQQQGFAHAALTFGLGDSAAGYAALTTIPEDQEVVTAEIKINLTAPATGDRLVARGRVVKPGRRLIVVTSEVVCVANGDETLVAILQGTMVPVPA